MLTIVLFTFSLVTRNLLKGSPYHVFDFSGGQEPSEWINFCMSDFQLSDEGSQYCV